nr:unnamed protein product [Digitaria exilis]
MASGASAAAATLKLAAIAACILLALLSLAPRPVAANPCTDACHDPCNKFADGFCGVPDPSKTCYTAVNTCHEQAFDVCTTACYNSCTSREIVSCI